RLWGQLGITPSSSNTTIISSSVPIPIICLREVPLAIQPQGCGCACCRLPVTGDGVCTLAHTQAAGAGPGRTSAVAPTAIAGWMPRGRGPLASNATAMCSGAQIRLPTKPDTKGITLGYTGNSACVDLV